MEKRKVSKNVQMFTAVISEILNVKPPKIIYSTQGFCTATQLALVKMSECSDNATIYIKPTASEIDACFAIAHETRHLWQFLHVDYKKNIVKHVGSGSLPINDYNTQLEELDANAFTTAMMTYFFGIRPLFSGLSTEVRNKIYSLSDEMKDELYVLANKIVDTLV